MKPYTSFVRLCVILDKSRPAKFGADAVNFAAGLARKTLSSTWGKRAYALTEGGTMADDPNKPKVGVYDDATKTSTVTEPAAEQKSGGIPSWVIGLIILAVVIIALILIF